MTRFLVTAMPFTGHVAPMSALAAALVEAGHDVRLYTGGAFRERVERTGARFVGWSQASDFDEQNLVATFPRLLGRKGLGQVLINVQDLFIGTAPGQLADARAEWEREPWDVLVSEEASLGPALIAEALGCRWATVAIVPLQLTSAQGPPTFGLAPGREPLGRARDAVLRGIVPLLTRALNPAVRRAAALAGVPAPRGTFDQLVFSRQLVLATGVPALDHDREDRPDFLHWIGRIAPLATANAPLPPWWGDLDGRRVIHVTQGTQNVDPNDLIRPALEALADVDALVVVATGIPGQESLPFPVPANVRVASLLPYDALLPRAELVITNGGWGGVLACLAQGIPLVVGGGDLDKPEVAARVASSGAGVNLRTGTPSAARVRAAVERVLGHPSYRDAARTIATHLTDAGGVARAVELLQQLADPKVSPAD